MNEYTMTRDFYVLFVEGDVEPELVGPFKTGAEQDRKAIELKKEFGDKNGIFWLMAPKGSDVIVGAYAQGDLDE